MDVTRMGLDDLVPGQPTPGMERKQAIVLDGLWSGTVRTDPGGVSGWHHHGDHDTVAYVVRGMFVVETAQGVVEAGPGEFVHIPPGVVHRESNPTEDDAHVVLVRRGSGPVVVNVDGPGSQASGTA